MKCKKIVSGLLALTLMFSVNNGTVFAEENQVDETLDQSDKIEYIEIDKEEVEPSGLEEREANNMDRQYDGEQYSITEEITTYKEGRTAAENTDPNYAYIVENDMVVQGAIEAAEEMRWYAFNLTEKSKVTVLLQMVDALDADLYMYALDGSTLNLIGGSATSGAGVTEYYNQVMEAGLYFFAVGGYEGTGNFAFAYYQSSKDVNIEVNDLLQSATNVSLNTDITGIIDNPYDVDCYKFTVSSPTIMKYSISTADNYAITFAAKDGNLSAAYELQGMDRTYKLMPGTYYFKVQSNEGKYSADSVYNVKFAKIGSLTSNIEATRTGICESANIVYQTNEAGTINYVNGKPIDYSYSLYKNLPNSAGLQIYDISIDPDLVDYVGNSEVIYYNSSTQPINKVSSRPVLALTLYGKDCYKVHCYGSGAYHMNTYNQNFESVQVLIDPETGDLVDIFSFNYYYDYAPVGTNYIRWYNGDYKLTFYRM